MYAMFMICGEPLTIMDGPGDHKYQFSEGISLMVNCDTQEEIDKYWNALTKNGGEESMCGWLKDPYGVSWQITPSIMGKFMGGNNPEGAKRAFGAMLSMKKMDIKKLQDAYDGK
jgi:predicted 3-demethylubiquinone-9 3-methyltransferase (glyoxalase superfamily)